ncbi:MAG: hypothetical protein DMF97_08835 [Acidobacteria bacterium]|nr:MAG: hypothetical protein DMF97_08835 [Acidobacteriota bacterium]
MLLSRIPLFIGNHAIVQNHERDFVHQIVTTGSIMGSNLASPEGLRKVIRAHTVQAAGPVSLS